MTKVLAPSSAARSTLRSTLRRPKRRTERSLAVKAPSLKTGWPKVLVVTISMTRPASSVACLKRVRIRSRSASSAPKGTTSSSWKVTPQAPSSASRVAYSHGSSAGRLAEPNWSWAVQPTVQRPKEKRSSGVGLRTMGTPRRAGISFVGQLTDASRCLSSDPGARAGDDVTEHLVGGAGEGRPVPGPGAEGDVQPRRGEHAQAQLLLHRGPQGGQERDELAAEDDVGDVEQVDDVGQRDPQG